MAIFVLTDSAKSNYPPNISTLYSTQSSPVCSHCRKLVYVDLSLCSFVIVSVLGYSNHIGLYIYYWNGAVQVNSIMGDQPRTLTIRESIG